MAEKAHPPVPPTPVTLRSQRRSLGGARHAASEKVVLTAAEGELTGWMLNVSRGGARIVLEESVERGSDYVALIGDQQTAGRPVRVVWVREEAGGQIAGLQFLDTEGTIPPMDEGDENS